MDLPRSQGSIAFAGDYLATVGSRPMGGIEAGSTLRSQRLNRTPLAVCAFVITVNRMVCGAQ